MILTAAPPGVRDEISSARVSGLLQVVCRLYTIYSPGGLSEREIGLRQIQEPSSGTSVRDTIEILRRWKRWCARMVELGGVLPDPSLQLKALERITKATLLAHPEVSFRISLTRASLQIDTCPDSSKVEQLHAQLLAELEALGHRLPKEDKPKDTQPGPSPKVKGVDVGDTPTPKNQRPKTNPKLLQVLLPLLVVCHAPSLPGLAAVRRGVIARLSITGRQSLLRSEPSGAATAGHEDIALMSARQV